MAKDLLQNLIMAVAHLQQAVKDADVDLSVGSITILDGKGGRLFDAHLRSSPSFLDASLYPDARNSPQVSEILGVKILAE